jgi:hypothetical protein
VIGSPDNVDLVESFIQDQSHRSQRLQDVGLEEVG